MKSERQCVLCFQRVAINGKAKGFQIYDHIVTSRLSSV